MGGVHGHLEQPLRGCSRDHKIPAEQADFQDLVQRMENLSSTERMYYSSVEMLFPPESRYTYEQRLKRGFTNHRGGQWELGAGELAIPPGWSERAWDAYTRGGELPLSEVPYRGRRP